MKNGLSEEQKREAVEELNKAVSLIGGPTATAKAIGFSKGAIQRWRSSGVVSPLAAKRLDESTGESISRSDMRPDLWDAGVKLEEAEVSRIKLELIERGINTLDEMPRL